MDIECAAPRRYRTPAILIASIALALIVVTSQGWLFATYTIEGASMEPTLHCSAAPGCRSRTPDRVLVDYLFFRIGGIERGDVVVLSLAHLRGSACGGGTTYIKRVVGLPGERPPLRQAADATKRMELRTAGTSATLRQRRPIPAGHFFVRGDNVRYSCDSRVFGPVPRRSIIGKVVLIYAPPGRFGPVPIVDPNQASPDLLLALSPFRDVVLVPGERFEATVETIMLALAAVTIFRRRDLTRR